MYTNPSWHAVSRQSSRNINAVSRSCAIFLHTKGSNTGQSSNLGHAGVPINFIGSYEETMLVPLAVVPLPSLRLFFVSDAGIIDVIVLDILPPPTTPPPLLDEDVETV